MAIKWVLALQAVASVLSVAFSYEHIVFPLTSVGKSGSSSICDPAVDQSAGYVSLNTGDKHYFYWLFSARDAPKSLFSESNAPLVLWLNGGPGCSSELGLFTENGPCSVNAEGTGTKLNDYAWNTRADLLFVDQPAGAGFSYGKDLDFDEEMVMNDFYDFLQVFFKKYDHLKSRDFYITGESYAGHYVPAIAHKIWQMNKNLDSKSQDTYINLKGIGIGNGMVNAKIQYQYYADMAISDNHHEAAVSPLTYKVMKAAAKACAGLISLCEKDIPGMCLTAVETCNLSQMGPYQATGRNPYDMRLQCEVPPLCNDYSNLEKFLNNKTVEDLLGIPSEEGNTWRACNQEVNIMFTMHGDEMHPTDWMIKDILDDEESEIKVVIYAGDQDYICNWIGNQAWVDQLEWRRGPEFATMELRPWLVKGKEKGMIKQLDRLTFLRVYEAGHMVPQDQPQASLVLINKLILGLPKAEELSYAQDHASLRTTEF